MGPNTNGQGFRGTLPEGPKPEGGRRVVVVGDSVTFGNGVPTEERWTDQAARALAATGADVELANLAVYSYDAGQCAATLSHRGWGLDPDLVVYAAYVNDHLPTDIMVVGGQPVWVGDSPGDGVVPFGERLWLAAARRSATARRALGALHARRGVRAREAAWGGDLSLLEGALDRMKAEAEARGVPLLIYALAPHPLAAAEGCEAPPDDAAFCTRNLGLLDGYHRAFARRGLPAASALAYLRGSGRRSFYLRENTIAWDPHHPTPEGHAVLAAGFLDTLARWDAGLPLADLHDSIVPEALPIAIPQGRVRKGRGPRKRGP